MSTETLTRPDAGLATIEGIDLTLEPACEHSRHAERHVATQPAWALVETLRMCCETGSVRYLICASGWLRMGAHGVLCASCHAVHPRDEGVRLITVL